MQIITLSAVPAQLWRNGAGLTRQLASGLAGSDARSRAVPAIPVIPNIDAFDWRISLADIKGDGPFSVFPGIDRCAVLLGDSPIFLSGPSGSSYLQPWSPLSFSGEAELHARCEPALSMPRILNLMVRRHTMRSRVEVIETRQVLPAAATLFVLIGGGEWEFTAPAQAPLRLSVDSAGIVHALAAGAVMQPCGADSKAIVVTLQASA